MVVLRSKFTSLSLDSGAPELSEKYLFSLIDDVAEEVLATDKVFPGLSVLIEHTVSRIK